MFSFSKNVILGKLGAKGRGVNGTERAVRLLNSKKPDPVILFMFFLLPHPTHLWVTFVVTRCEPLALKGDQI